MGTVAAAALVLAGPAVASATAPPASSSGQTAAPTHGHAQTHARAPVRAVRSTVSARPSLSARERAAGRVLARQRAAFLRRFRAHPDRLFAAAFLAIRDKLDHSAIRRSIASMPKGGMLHIHSTATGSAEWIVDRALAEPGAYIYWGAPTTSTPLGKIAFFPSGVVPDGYVAASALEGSVPDLREQLLKLYTLGPEDFAQTNRWPEFEAVFSRIDGLISYRPVFVDYYTDAFLRLARDGVQFAEFRTTLSAVRTADGGTIVDEGVIDLYRQAVARVRVAYPEFDLRIVVSGRHTMTLAQAAVQLARQSRLHAYAPDLVDGFDLIGQEDTGNPTAFYAPVLSTSPQTPLVLHGGESSSPDNHNVATALDLGALRIGHAVNMGLFPGLEDRVKAAGVTIESCPISNQELNYVPDLRAHPAKGWLRRGVRVTLNSDDPSIYGTTGLTDDLTMAYLSWGIGLQALKRMALRSIAASLLPPERKLAQRRLFQRSWDRWVDAVAASAGATAD